MFSYIQLRHEIQQSSQRNSPHSGGIFESLPNPSINLWMRENSPHALLCGQTLMRLMRAHTCNLSHQLLLSSPSPKLWKVQPWCICLYYPHTAGCKQWERTFECGGMVWKRTQISLCFCFLKDITELDKLEVLPSLTELSVVGNPVSIISVFVLNIGRC